MASPNTRNAAPANAGNRASKSVRFSTANSTQDSDPLNPLQEFVDDLRQDCRHLRMTLVRAECIGLAISKGVIDLATAREMRCSLPTLGPDTFTADFLQLVEDKRAAYEAEQKRRRKYRRAA